MSWTVFVQCVLLLEQAWSKIVLKHADNVLLLKENTGTGMDEFWNLNKSYNDPNNDKHSKPVHSLISKGNFRSAMLESWETGAPDEMAVMFFNMLGDLHFWMMFDTKNISRDLKAWMTPSRFLGSSVSGMYQMFPEWTQDGYELSFTSPLNTKLSWFAITKWNIFNGLQGQPFFVFPLVGTDPFKRLQVHQTATPGIILLASHGPYLTNTQKNIQISLGNAYYLKAIKVVTAAGTASPGTYRVDYSPESQCTNAAYMSYRDSLGNIVELELNEYSELHTLQVYCMWIMLKDLIDIRQISVYGPSHFKVDMITVPILVFRGFWYGEEKSTTVPLSSPSTDATVSLETSSKVSTGTKSLQTTTVMSTSFPENNNMCACACFHATGNASQTNIEEKIEFIKKTMTLNKTKLSSHKRRFISVPDDRVTAQSIGYVAGVFMCLVLGFIVILDLTSLSKYLLSLKVNKVRQLEIQG